MRQLLSYFRQAFHIAPITLKTSKEKKHSKKKRLVIYLLSKYSKENFDTIASEFHLFTEDVQRFSLNNKAQVVFEQEIKLFFKQFEDDYLLAIKRFLAMQEIAVKNGQ